MEWLLDAWTTSDGVRLCITDGSRPRYADAGHLVTFLVATAHPARLERLLDGADGVMVEHGRVTTLLGEERDVLAVTAAPGRARRMVRAVEHWMGGEPDLFNADVDPVQEFMARRGLFPLCSVDRRLRTGDDPWDIEVALPPLKVMRVDAPPNWRWRGVEPLSVTSYDTVGSAGDAGAPAAAAGCAGAASGQRGECTEAIDVAGLAAALDERDPDVLIVPDGDEVLPEVSARAEEAGIRLRLDRVPSPGRRAEARVLHSYGRPVFRAGPWTLRGRVHIPGGFMFAEAGLEGVVEISRIAHISLQRAARTSPGTVISAMQVNHMLRNGIPVPWRKNSPEAIKTFRELALADRGGFIFTPRPGLYRHVHELDFAAMYPSIMVRHNISPETLFSDDIDAHVVPELGYRIRRARQGVIPAVLEPLIARRAALKARGDDASLRRAGALKWLLVTCFGYTGYRNAKLGRIEAHEAINAYGREYMLRAAEAASGLGFSVVHGIIDSLWVTGGGDVTALVDRINAATGLSIKREATFRWMVFLPVSSGARGALNRYYGMREDGEVKVRGIALRRRDVAPIV
ncbi:MAG: hypothetical protein L0Z54_04070, partial [Thermoplasmata archaeon]|nr:hypothetical protein [Thermoplasmata archaeon]